MSDGKSIVVAFFAAVNSEGMGALRRFVTDDMTWWAPGLGELAPEKLISMVESLASVLDQPIRFTVHDIIVEDDRVAAEVASYAALKSGKIYNNKYHFKFLVRAGAIAKIREYHDTKHAFEVFDLHG
jgi:ketosteroid isomerase-like protein